LQPDWIEPSRGRTERSRLRVALHGAGVALLAAVAPIAAGEPAAEPAAEIPLERLFKLPDSVGAPAVELRRGGKTRAEWQARFEKAQSDLDAARKALEATRAELEGVAPGRAWSMSAPGLPVNPDPSETSVDFRLRQQMRSQREDVERAERSLHDLAIEANLAEVPDDWRAPDRPADAAASSGAAP
jgi:hypothetical protein